MVTGAAIAVMLLGSVWLLTIRDGHGVFTEYCRWMASATGPEIAGHFPRFWWWFWGAGRLWMVLSSTWYWLIAIIFGAKWWLGLCGVFILFNIAYKRSRYRKPVLATVTVLLVLAVTTAGIWAGELFLRTRIQLGMFTDDIQMVDSVINYNLMWSDSLGINRHTVDSAAGVNSDGFISRFEYDTVTRNAFKKQGKKVLFIVGDSFVEGVSSSSPDSSFVAMLKAEIPEWAIYNFGVGGLDPLNYRLILEQYVPALKPDAVLLVFCNND